jgi:hypothetical protein
VTDPDSIGSFVGWDQIAKRAPAHRCKRMKDEGGRMKAEQKAFSFILHPSAFILSFNGGPATATREARVPGLVPPYG